MRLSKLIQELQTIQKEDGDITVRVFGGDVSIKVNTDNTNIKPPPKYLDIETEDVRKTLNALKVIKEAIL